ncbi:MAG: AraC family transcriptional regulator [Planctomycetota bacterium]
MDNFSTHLLHLPRRFPFEAPVGQIGHMVAKRDRVVHTFDSLNFSFILEGSGSYRWRGTTLPVVAPMVLTQWPGEPMDYGPNGTWRELYIIYPAAAVARFRSLGLFDPGRPLWPVGSTGPFLATVAELLRVLYAKRLPDAVDRIDRLAESAIVESLLAADPGPLSERDRQVLSIRQQVDRSPPGAVDPEAEALRQGLRTTHFRRLWERLVGIPPARYTAERRLREAARRLAEGTDPVRTIASALGFPDPLYFSRRFRVFSGVSPVQYRRRYHDVHTTKPTASPR